MARCECGCALTGTLTIHCRTCANSGSMADESKDASPPRRARGRRGRRGTVCAVPVKLEAGWKPRVVDKSEEARERCVALPK